MMGHGGAAGMSMAAMVRDMRNRFLVAAVFSVPILLWSPPGACPAAGRPVVLTSAAVEALDDTQLAAVLAHERAHQRGRHHLLVSLAGSLAAAFPRVPMEDQA